MVPGDPDLVDQQGLGHGRIDEGTRLDVAPEPLEIFPHRGGGGAPEFEEGAVGERGVQIALEEAVHQALLPGGEAERLFAGFLVDVRGPFLELLIGQGVQRGALGQVGQGFLVRGHDEGGLHPREVEDVLPVEPAQLHQVLRKIPGVQFLVERVERPQGAALVQALEIAVQGSHQDRGGGILLELRIHEFQQVGVVVGPEVDGAREILQDRVLHFPGFFHGIELGREEGDFGGRFPAEAESLGAGGGAGRGAGFRGASLAAGERRHGGNARRREEDNSGTAIDHATTFTGRVLRTSPSSIIRLPRM